MQPIISTNISIFLQTSIWPMSDLKLTTPQQITFETFTATAHNIVNDIHYKYPFFFFLKCLQHCLIIVLKNCCFTFISWGIKNSNPKSNYPHLSLSYLTSHKMVYLHCALSHHPAWKHIIVRLPHATLHDRKSTDIAINSRLKTMLGEIITSSINCFLLAQWSKKCQITALQSYPFS